MAVNFIVFSVDSGVIKSSRPVPDFFHRIAFDAYVAIRNSGKDVEQARIDTMVAVCLQMLKTKGVEDPNAPQPVLLQDTSFSPNDTVYSGDVSVLNDLLCKYDHDAKRYAWASAVANGESLQSSQMMAAYALQRADAAAVAYLAGNNELAIQMLAEACSATADYGFHGGFDDHITMIKEDAAQAANKGWAPLKEVQAHAIARWQDGGKAKWKSMRNCSLKITEEILALAVAKGRPMKADNAERTIYEWIRHAEKRTG